MRPPVRRTGRPGRLYYKIMPQKFFAAPVDRHIVRSFSLLSSALLSRLIVYSSSRLCSLFFVSYSLSSRMLLSVTLTVRFCQLRSLRSLPAFLFFFLFILFFTPHDTHFLFLILFFRQFSATLIFVISYIYSSDTYCWNFFRLMLFIYWFYTELLTLSARVLCTLFTLIFLLFITRNVPLSI